MRRVGAMLGEEAAALGVDVLLGPGANMKRDPRCGRNFEYFSEDPFLSGELAGGTRIAELAIVDKLGVSRTPIRAALMRLEQEGLLERMHGGGYAVMTFTMTAAPVSIMPRPNV